MITAINFPTHLSDTIWAANKENCKKKYHSWFLLLQTGQNHPCWQLFTKLPNQNLQEWAGLSSWACTAKHILLFWEQNLSYMARFSFSERLVVGAISNSDRQSAEVKVTSSATFSFSANPAFISPPIFRKSNYNSKRWVVTQNIWFLQGCTVS